MEINITEFFNDAEPSHYAASCMELGDDAGAITWQNALEAADDFMLIDDDEKREALREHIRAFGAWEDDEIANGDHAELNALFIQMVSGDIRETGVDVDSWDWGAYEQASRNGQIGSTLFPDDDGNVYYILGS